MELHRLRASQVSAAQPLKIIYHRKQKLSNGFLVVVVVYASQINIILIVLKPIVLPQETYPYIQSPFRLLPPCIQIIQISISSFHIVIIRTNCITNNTFCRK